MSISVSKSLLISALFIILLVTETSASLEPFVSDKNRALVELVPEVYRAKVIAALKEAGDNWHQLASVIKDLPPDQREGVAFLIANMPHPDLVSISSDVLFEHVVYAYKAWEETPWGGEIPKDLFLNYVLPYRISLEPIGKWRKDFYQRLHPRLKGLKSIAEAAVEVNRWGKENCSYGPTYRFQSPYTTLKRHQGDCHTQSILYIAALRSVCIPARYVFTPYYTHRRGYHAWAEVWDGRWYPTGGCEPAPLGKPWFVVNGSEKLAAKVYAVSYTKTALLGEGESIGTWKTNLLDITDSHTPLGTIKVKVTDQGKPVPHTRVYFSVWNYSTFLPVSHLVTDEHGQGEVRLGDGAYFVTAGQSEENTWEFVYVDPNEVTEVTLEISASKTGEVYDFSNYKFER